MGNAESFGIIRDKQRIKTLFNPEFSGSLSVGKFETIHYDLSMEEPITQLEEIENYCKDIKNSKAWVLHSFPNPKVLIETFSGSIWSDFVPVVRVTYEGISSLTLQDLFELITNTEKIKIWDEYRTNIERMYERDLIIEEYQLKFPFKMRKFKDFFGFKDIENGFEVSTFVFDRKPVGKTQNFFTIWKVLKIGEKVMVQIIKQTELGIRRSKELEFIYAKFVYLNTKPFFELV